MGPTPARRANQHAPLASRRRGGVRAQLCLAVAAPRPASPRALRGQPCRRATSGGACRRQCALRSGRAHQRESRESRPLLAIVERSRNQGPPLGPSAPPPAATPNPVQLGRVSSGTLALTEQPVMLDRHRAAKRRMPERENSVRERYLFLPSRRVAVCACPSPRAKGDGAGVSTLFSTPGSLSVAVLREGGRDGL
jgi:hypothetical protein